MRALCGVVLAAATLASTPGTGTAQEPTDSLAAELRRLRARLDSLERIVQQLTQTGRDTSAAAAELAALRAAAARATAEAPPSVAPQESRTRNLSALNPEISVTGDAVGNMMAPSGAPTGFGATPREFEFSFQAALDPYTHTKIFVTRHEDFGIAGLEEEEEGEEGHGFEIEEGYMYWVGLPGRLGLKLGKFRQEIGLYNRWHTHALLEVDRPLVSRAFFGEDDLTQTGGAVTLPSLTVGPATQTLLLEVTAGTNEALFDGGSQISYLGRFTSFWEPGGGVYFQAGATGVWGQNDDVGLETRVLGLDGLLRWQPPGRSLYRDLQLRGEWYIVEREVAGAVDRGTGGYAQVNARLSRRWILGSRVDYVNGFAGDPRIVQFVPSVTWWQSEWVRLRLQYNLVRPQGGGSHHTVLLQAVWAVGPHKHEVY